MRATPGSIVSRLGEGRAQGASLKRLRSAPGLGDEAKADDVLRRSSCPAESREVSGLGYSEVALRLQPEDPKAKSKIVGTQVRPASFPARPQSSFSVNCRC